MRYSGLLCGLCLLVGCAGVELDTVNPPGVSLNGEWLVDFSASDPLPNLNRRDPVLTGKNRPRSVGGEAMRILDGSALAFVAADFQVLKADKLTIEQNRDSMGIRYQPGVYRDITWGERQRGLWEVNAGWQERTLVIISTAKDLRVEERLNREGDRLTVDVLIEADGQDLTLQRAFNLRS
jgi:hypothetical protein